MNIQRIKQNTIFGFTLVIFLSSAIWGYSNGIKAAQSKAVLNNAQSINDGLRYFYDDQDRYPTSLEFTDNNIMAAYLSNLPAKEFVTDNCPQSYSYSNPFPLQFQLDVCISKATGKNISGWNIFSTN